MAPLLVLSLAVLPVAPMVSVEAPGRILISGQSMSCAAPATDCWDVADELEKKLENLSLKEGELDAGGGESVAVVDGVPRRLVPEQPDASSARNSNDAQWLRRITPGTMKPGPIKPGAIKGVFRRIPPTHRLARDAPKPYTKRTVAIPRRLCFLRGEAGRFG
jgi:hypothetical protein